MRPAHGRHTARQVGNTQRSIHHRAPFTIYTQAARVFKVSAGVEDTASSRLTVGCRVWSSVEFIGGHVYRAKLELRATSATS